MSFISRLRLHVLTGSVIFLTTILTLLPGVDAPFLGKYDWNSNTWSLIAKNYLRYGFACTKGGQSITYPRAEGCEQLHFYMNHPPFITWVLAVAFTFFGWSERIARAPFLLSTAVSSVLLYAIVTLWFSRFTGLLSSIFFIALPIVTIYGKAVNHEPMVLMFLLLSLWAFTLWIQKNDSRYYYIYLTGSLFVGLTGWHGYILFFLLCGLTKLCYRHNYHSSLLPCFLLVGLFVFHMIHSSLVLGAFNTYIVQWFLIRTNLGAMFGMTSRFTLMDYGSFFRIITRWLSQNLTATLLLLSVSYLVWQLRGFFHHQHRELSHRLLRTLLIYGVLIIIIFSQQVYEHEYLIIYLAPYVAVSGAWIVNNILHRATRVVRPVILILIVGFVFYERTELLNAVVTPVDAHTQQAYELTKIMQRYGVKGARFLLEVNRWYQFPSPMIDNYAFDYILRRRSDDVYSFQESEREIINDYDFLITLLNFSVDPHLTKYLQGHYPKEEWNEITLYTLK